MQMSFVQSLATAIAATNVLSAKQVVKNENGEEVSVAVVRMMIRSGQILYFIYII